jgi:hypothetical protein
MAGSAYNGLLGQLRYPLLEIELGEFDEAEYRQR